jgi:RNA polymerase sigma-70 factor, ECF subfamily
VVPLQPAAPAPASRETPLASFDETVRLALRRLRAGEGDDAFAPLDACLRPRLLAYFRADRNLREEADDLVQKTLTRVLQGVGGLRADESFLPWLFTIARNVRRNELDRRRRESRLRSGDVEGVEEPRDPRPGPLETRIDEEQRAALEAAVARLPRQQRQCLMLRVRMELSYEEVAATLSLSVLTVRNHLALARRSLRQALGGSVEEGDPV